MDEEIVRRAEEHLDPIVGEIARFAGEREHRIPELTRVTPEDCHNTEVDCDVCDNIAVDPERTNPRFRDGWQTSEQRGVAVDPDPEFPTRERIGYFVLCTPCKEAWERGDYEDLYKRADSECLGRVDDLAQLAGDTLWIRDEWRQQRDDGYGYEL